MTGPAVLAAFGLLAVGLVLRLTVGLVRRLHVPAAAVGGVVGAAAVQALHYAVPASAAARTAQALAAEWATWPGTLIAVVFAGLLLGPSPDGSFADALRRGVRSATLAWVIILGQIAVGLAVYVVAVRPGRPDIPATFGQLLEVSWAGGPGSAAAMGTLYAARGFAEGRDLAFFLSTVGLVYGVVSGLAFVNLAIRRGWVATPAVASTTRAVDAGPPERAATSAEAIEPLAVQAAILAAAYAGGLGLQAAFAASAHSVLPAGPALNAAGNVPLFLFTLLGGWAVRRAMALVGLAHWIDTAALQRLAGVAMELLIVAGIASVRIDTLGAFIGPTLLLLVSAAVWSAFCLLVLSRRLLPAPYWFELGLLNYGFSTANTPQGLMLLRIIDPHLRSGAAEDYAVAAPLSAPFVGGGVVTFVVLPVLLERVSPAAVLGAVCVLIILLIAAGLRFGPRPGRGSVT